LAIIAILGLRGEITMPAPPTEHPRVPLTRFHNNTGEFLDLATKQPIVLTSHGRDRYVIADSEYFRHLEEAARGVIAGHMNIEAVASSDMIDADRQAFAIARPSASELANDRWED
jgi:PHD/YefM family antitoxin component YafN of YafNO toxin-antitoxin module